MACKTSYELYHNFPKIADEAGFTFNTHRPRIHIDWNKIRLIDIENLTRERKFILIEQHVNDILDCVLESEFDVRILDEGVLKMFRLAQLAVEYQQFCRHYLDRSVHVLKEEITSLAQELDITKKELKERDEEIRKLKRKSKQTYRYTPLQYGNDNIASMILKTLSQKNEIFSCSTGDALQYNKCSYCDKVFLNQLYLKSHISRRHPNVQEIPQRDSEESIHNKPNNPENDKLRGEISELKSKLKEMEVVIKNSTEQINSNAGNQKHADSINTDTMEANIHSKLMKDAEVATNSEEYWLDRIEVWKKEEQEKYHKEIQLLRTQIMESFKTFKENETPSVPTRSDLKIIDELNSTISQQGAEILALKQELINSRLKIEKDEAERRKESEAQIKILTNRAETHAKQYESLLHKLDQVAIDAQASRAQAEAERKKVAQLENMLQNNLKGNQEFKEKNDSPHTKSKRQPIQKVKDHQPETLAKQKNTSKPHAATDRQTLEKLHQKAQALLNMASLSSSSSDISSEDSKLKLRLDDTKMKGPETRKKKIKDSNKKIGKKKKINIDVVVDEITKGNVKTVKDKHFNEDSKCNGKIPKFKSNDKSNSTKIQKNGAILAPGSPIKILRAKITEEVNNRLISAGVDPLKCGLPMADYQKHKMMLQQQIELKSKINQSHEKFRHSILAYLDSTTPKKISIQQEDYGSPNKVSKPFSLTSVISNVKNKALSFVKSNDISTKDKRKSLNSEVAKRALSILKTPPDSVPSSPTNISDNELYHKSSSPKKTRRTSGANKKRDKSEIFSQHTNIDSDDTNESDNKYYKTVQQSAASIENLIKSPARRPLSANSDYIHGVRKYSTSEDNLVRSQSVVNVSNPKTDIKIENHRTPDKDTNLTSDTDTSENVLDNDAVAKDNIKHNLKQTKGVLKNASSTSSLNKKKVLFDMDAIQMKSLSASPSQSITEKSDGNEKYELGLINLDGEEWDISSIENEPLKNDTKLHINTKPSPKIAELKQTIESQLARRDGTPSTAIVGGVDLLTPSPKPMLRASSIGGSNTSLGSSILDDSESPPVINNKAFVKPKTITQKDDSELDISEFSTDGIISNKNKHDAF